MSVSCQLVLQTLRELCPPRLALEGDPTGLQVGSADKPVQRVLCTLDLTLAVAEEAARLGAGLVVSHHAVIYRALKDLRTDLPRGRILERLIKDDVAVYVPHTATDVVQGGINDRLAQLLELTDVEPLKQTRADPEALVRLQLGSDEEDSQRLLDLARRGGESTTQQGQVLWVRAPRARALRLATRLQAAGAARPLVLESAEPSATHGIGRVGRPSGELTAEQLGQLCRERLQAPMVRVAADDAARPVRKVALLAGDGRSFMNAACFAGCDAMVTGDVDHHSALEARARGLALIDVGHWAGEQFVPGLLAQGLRERLEGKAVEILESQVSTQPFTYL